MLDRGAARRAWGAAGERLAAAWLERAGGRVLARNFRCREGEVDLVVEEADELVFVEVRTRRVGALVGPEESVSLAKRARIRRAAEAYLAATGNEERPWRIDLVAVELDTRGRLARLERFRHILE